MTQASGVNAKLAFVKEATYGTAPTTGFLLPFNSSSVAPSRAVNTPATITGTRNPVVPFEGNTIVQGTVVVPVDYAALWYWLDATFATIATTGSDPYTHEFKYAAADTQPSFSMEHQFLDLDTPEYSEFNGCKVSSWKMDIGGDGELTTSFDIIGSTYTGSGSKMLSVSETAISCGRLDNFEAVITEGGGAFSNGTAMSFNVDFGLTPQYVIGGSGTAGSISEGMISATGTLTALFEDDSLITKAVASTESSLKVVITTGSYSLEVEFAELQYALAAPPIDGPQGLLQTFNWTAFYTDGSEASVVLAELINADAHA